MEDKAMSDETPHAVSRRNFIRGVIAAGAVASSSAYLFRAAVQGQPAAAGAVERLLTLNVNGPDRRVDVMPQDTLAWPLRYQLGLAGTNAIEAASVRSLAGDASIAASLEVAPRSKVWNGAVKGSAISSTSHTASSRSRVLERAVVRRIDVAAAYTKVRASHAVTGSSENPCRFSSLRLFDASVGKLRLC